MSLGEVGDVVGRRKGYRALLLLVALVSALVVGLLAMHTIASASGEHASGSMWMAMTVEAHGDVAADPPHSPDVDCAGACDPGHSMVAMVCILALLVTSLTLFSAIAQYAFGNARQDSGRGGANVTVPTSALEDRAPPDLTLLSISRT